MPMRPRRPLPPSLYADTARPPPETPPLDGDCRVSVAVIGGGFTGLSAATHLAEQGVDVLVLEAQEPGWGASGRNGGQVNPGLKHDPDRVEADFGPDLGRRMVAMAWNAPNVVFDLIRRYQIDCEARQSGTIRAAFGATAASGIRASAEQGLRRGMPVTLLEGGELRAATGNDRYRCAMLDRRGGHANPLGYARGLAQAAMQAGARVHGGTPALRVGPAGRDWVVETPTGTVRAEKLIIATNGYTDDLWPRLRRSVVPVFSAIAATAKLPAETVSRVMPIGSSLYEMGRTTVYYRVAPSGHLLMGGRSVQRDVASPAELPHLVAYAQRLWPALRGVAWTHGWSGQLAMTTDHYPHVHEPAEGVLVALGYNGRGVAMSTAMGPLLARRATGGRGAEIDMPVTTIREVPFHGLWRSAVAARLAYGRIRDRIGL